MRFFATPFCTFASLALTLRTSQLLSPLQPCLSTATDASDRSNSLDSRQLCSSSYALARCLLRSRHHHLQRAITRTEPLRPTPPISCPVICKQSSPRAADLATSALPTASAETLDRRALRMIIDLIYAPIRLGVRLRVPSTGTTLQPVGYKPMYLKIGW